jgi:hypothetical protein
VSTRARVALVVGLVLAFVVAAIATDGSDTAQVRVETGARIEPRRDVTTTWYCAEGTATPDGRADEELVLGSVDTRGARALVTVMAGSEVPPATRRVDVPAGRAVRLRVGDIAPVADPGVVVESTGGALVVEHRITRGADTALGPCAREPALEARFAAGTTGRGAELWVALFNPFPDEAIVDLRAVTESGVRAPARLQGVVVSRFSRLAVPVHEVVPRVDLVAVSVTTRRGRVVTEQSLTLDGSDGRRGLALSVGAPAADRWTIPGGRIGGGRTERLLLANPGARDTRVTVHFTLDAAAAIEPQRLLLPGSSVTAVDLEQVPPGIGFAAEVRARTPVVAEMIGAAGAPIGAQARGIASDLGLIRGAARWSVVPARLGPRSRDTLALLAADGRAHRVRIVGFADARRRVLDTVRVPAVGRTVVDVAALEVDPDATLRLVSDGPVFLERESQRPGFTRSHGVRG